MRAFIGVNFSDEVKQDIMEMQRVIRSSSIKGRWKYIANFHLTLKFLGEISEDSAFSIYEKMSDSLKCFEAFDLRCGSAGYFSGDGCLRVIYLGFDNISALEDLFTVVENCCYECGFHREVRKFTPHITLAQDVVLLNDFKRLKTMIDNIHKPVIEIKEISIIKSEQVGGKRIYTDLMSVPLSLRNKNKSFL